MMLDDGNANLSNAAAPPMTERSKEHTHGSFEPFGNCLLCAECTR
jgi:hypothetical protein